MKFKELLYLVAGILLTATLIPTFMSVSDIDANAQISIQPTPTFTPIPPTPTNTPTPIPPTPTNTPIPPTPTPTNTPIPIPPPPTLSLITIDPPEALAALGMALDFTVVFTEPLPPIAAATWSWGDGSTTSCSSGSTDCTVNPGSGTQGLLTGSHAYSEPGVYTVRATVEDIYGQFDTSTYEFVVAYDPSGGFVTGGGWIDSPPDAYVPNPSLTGKATFGFVSKYKRGSTRPTGNTQFQFKVADLKFFSDTYDWLVVNQGDSNAQFKGSGTINGASAPTGEDYRFMIWATDGSASNAADAFRIKIWYEEEDLEFAIYDNGVAQAIGDGHITIHKPSKE